MSVMFKNPGLIPLEAISLFGASVKVTDNPIGEFGTGLKMAIAVITRLGGSMHIFRDGEHFEFYTKRQSVRDRNFEVVRMKRRAWLGGLRYTAMPFTTELARKWAPWQAVREIEANCRDERGWSSLTDGWTDRQMAEASRGSTIVVVDCAEFEEAYRNIGDIFLETHGRRLIWSSDQIEIWSGENKFIWFRGLRVTDLRRPSLLTYNFRKGVDLTEDRTSKSPHVDQIYVRDALVRASAECPEIVSLIADLDDGSDTYEGELYWEGVSNTDPAVALANALSSHLGNLAPRVKTFVERSVPALVRDPLVSMSLPLSMWYAIVQTLEGGMYDDLQRAKTIRARLADKGHSVLPPPLPTPSIDNEEDLRSMF